MPDYLENGPADAPLTIVLAHGAGAPMDTPFMDAFAWGIADLGYRVVRFEFPYMRRRRDDGKRRGPDRPQVLQDTWREVAAALAGPLVLGGKSMGGRVASMLADDLQARGLLCLGYPFHPAGKPQQLRIDHLRTLSTPALIVQGERDALGSREDLAPLELSPQIRLHWLPDGDHSFKPRKSSGLDEQQNWEEGVHAIGGWLSALSG